MNILIAIIISYLYYTHTFVNAFNLTILHNNDFHSHFAPFDKFGNECDEQMNRGGNCFGGAARTVSKVKELKSQIPNALFLNGGDHFQGTIWYSFYKWSVVAKFVKLMKHDAMALGNHEFDDGISGENGLAMFVQNMTDLPILSCNIDTSNEPLLDGYVKKSVILTVNDRKIAVIGYTTPETKDLSAPGKNLIFNDEIESIRNEIESIKRNNPQINIFIALGHSGITKDKEIAESIPILDVVVGGHTNTFLYSGDTEPSDEKIQGKYPEVITHSNGQITLIVQAFAYGKYLGKLDLRFDDNGNIINYGGNPILLDKSQNEDPETSKSVNEMAEKIKQKFGHVIGSTVVDFPTTDEFCRKEECNLGNLVTDAFVNYFVQSNRNQNHSWTTASIAIVNGGLIRAGITIGNITIGQIITLSPFANDMGIVKLSGEKLFQVLEKSVADYDTTFRDNKGRFLQMSGMKVEYDLSLSPGQRVRNALVRCSECHVPKYESIDRNKIYSVIITEYLSKGGDGYDMLNGLEFDTKGDKDFDIIRAYIEKRSPMTMGIEGRIKFINSMNNSSNISNISNTFTTIVSFLLTLFTVFINSKNGML